MSLSLIKYPFNGDPGITARFGIEDATLGSTRAFDFQNGDFAWNNITEDDTSVFLLGLDGSNNIRSLDATAFVAKGNNLQVTTDLGNTTTNEIVSQRPHDNAFSLITVDATASLGFTTQPGGWSSVYIGSNLPYAAPGTSDKANIFIGILPGQSRTAGGDFNMFLGYQAGIGDPANSYKFYLAQGTSNHLIYGDFATGKLSVNSGIYIGGGGTWTTMPMPTARLELAAGSATAGTAPIKLHSGTLLTTPVTGTIEYLTDKMYLTITSGTARKEFTMNDGVLTSGRIPYATTNGRLLDAADFRFIANTAGGGPSIIVGSSTLTSASSLTTLSFIQTWNNASAQPVVIGMSINDTASDANFSYFLNLRNNTAGVAFQVDKFGSVSAGNPGNGSAIWRLGGFINAASTLKTTGYVEVMVNGSVVKFATMN